MNFQSIHFIFSQHKSDCGVKFIKIFIKLKQYFETEGVLET